MKNVLFGLVLSVWSAAEVSTEPVILTVDPSTVRSIGDITTFEREKYIVVHASPTEGDSSDETIRYITEELEAHFGRDGGVQTGRLMVTPAAPGDPDMPDLAFMKAEGAAWNEERAANPWRYQPEWMQSIVMCTHPEYMVGRPSNETTSWGPRSPEAAAEFVAHFLKYYYTDETRPQLYEVFNEPFIKAKKTDTTAEQMARQHVVTAKRIREVLPDDDIMIGGYSAAWAEVEARNFAHWNSWQKMFMDVAGEEMDFFSTHLYDGVNVKGTHAERTGSNTEAILDLIDAYSFIKWGVAKPQAITEYGRINKSPDNRQWPDRLRRMGILLASFNGMMVTYMDHPDRLLMTVPYILPIGSWTYGNSGNMTSSEDTPNSFLLFRRAGDNYVTTELDKFYRVWKGVRGERRVTRSDDPDVRAHYFADGLRHTVVLHNMDDRPREVSLSGADALDITKVTRRSLQTHGEVPMLAEQTLFGLPDEVTLQVGETMMLLLDLREPHDATQTMLETRVYATEYLKDVEAEKPVTFTFEDVPSGEGGAVLRLSIGRKPDLSLQPIVRVGGHELEVPTDWAGSNQEGRPTFFGMIEVPVPSELLQESMTFELTFPDTGGKVAAAVLQTNLVSSN